LNIAEIVIELTTANGLYLQQRVNVQSYLHSEAHRSIICFGFDKLSVQISKLTIYKAVGIYSEEYQEQLQSYFIAF
jgi:tRNA1Val (adenine37-N6)-methyltransferase